MLSAPNAGDFEVCIREWLGQPGGGAAGGERTVCILLDGGRAGGRGGRTRVDGFIGNSCSGSAFSIGL